MKITVLDRASLGDDTPLEILKNIAHTVTYDKTPPELVAQRCCDSDIIIVNKVKITRETLIRSKKLKLVCVFATGYDNIDTVAARELGIAVCNVPGYSTDSVALFTVATALSLFTQLSEYGEYVSSGNYTRSGVPNMLTPVYHELKGRTWGIVGLGNIGRAVAKIAEALGARVIACKRSAVGDVECVGIDELCVRSDIITLHCPLTDETRGLINKERISKMKDGVIIVNEARGSVVNEADIRNAVLSKKIGGFGSDVYSEEPFGSAHPYNEIKELKNVILTPHAAWGSYESRKRCIEIIASNINAFLNGEIQNRVEL